MKLIQFLIPLAACGLSLVGCKKAGDASAPTGAKPIAVIAKSTTNSYWKAVEAGARRAASEAHVEIIWTGPEPETNHAQQAAMVDNMVNRGVGGIVLAPTNVDALVRPVESAVAKNIPVVLIDSTLHSDKPISVVATDNYAAGRQAGDALVAAIGDRKPFGGKVIMLRFIEGAGSTEAREKGFADRVKEAGLVVVDEKVYTKGGGSTTDAADTADALLRRYSKGNALQVDGIFASNQPTAIGMLRKIQQFKKAGTKIDAPFVGFDSHEVLLRGVRDGDVAAIVTQDPAQIGYQGFKAMVDHLAGRPVPATIATKTATVTRANIDTPEIKAVTLEP